MSELNDVLTFEENGKSYTLTMYAGILNKIAQATNGIDGLDLVSYDVQTQSKLVECVLTDYDDSGNSKGFILSPFKLSSNNFQKILSWGLEHYTVFIVNSSKSSMEIMNKLKDTMTKDENNSTATEIG